MKRAYQLLLLLALLTLFASGCEATTPPIATSWNLSEGRWETYTQDNGLPHNYVRALAIDAEGRVWVGTDRAGVLFDGTHWKTIIPWPSTVRDIVFDNQGHAWFADSRGVQIYDGTGLTTYSRADGLNSTQSEVILADSQGHIWIAYNVGGDADSNPVYGGIDLLEDGQLEQMKHFGERGQLLLLSVLDMAEDRDGGIWAVGDMWIARFDGTSWKSIVQPDHPETPIFRCMAVAPSGHIWFGTRSLGLWILDGEEWTHYTAADGLASDSVWEIAFDEAGRAWVGTNNGLSVFDGETWVTYTTENGLVHNSIRALAFADDGVWIGTWKGLSHLVFP